MKSVSDVLRDADPLREPDPEFDAARWRMREALRVAPPPSLSGSRTGVSRRQLVAGGASLVAAAAVLTTMGGRWSIGTPVQAAVRFEVRLAEVAPQPGLLVAQVGRTGRLVYLHPEPLVTNEDVAQSWMSEEQPGSFSVHVAFLAPAAERLDRATANHLGRPVAILIDGQPVIVPVLRSPIRDSAVITGHYSQDDARRVADGIALR